MFFQMLVFAIVLALIIYFEIPKILKRKAWLELSVFSVVFLIGSTLLTLWMLGVKIPAPFKALGVY